MSYALIQQNMLKHSWEELKYLLNRDLHVLVTTSNKGHGDRQVREGSCPHPRWSPGQPLGFSV